MKIKKGLAVDIDETLSWTIGYWVQEMQKRFGNPENLSAEELIKKYKYTSNVPYWQTKEALDWLHGEIENNELQEKLNVIKDSVKFLNKIDKIIPVVAYISTRPETIRTGTEKWLEKNGFPKAEIILRPKDVSSADGNKWKAKVLESVYPKIIGMIDDNQGLVDCLSKDYKGTVFLYGANEVKPSNIRVISCKDWQSVFEAVKISLLKSNI